ncbi:hypothetical protein [Clostridium thailandense]|uniref:hypothetical protein n=1 Tax=Clostridium thailandense TaxID=2794346 RepID=UPI0039895B33
MTLNRAIEIIVKNTRFAPDYIHAASIIDPEEREKFFNSGKETYKKRIEGLRTKRIDSINRQEVKQHA